MPGTRILPHFVAALLITVLLYAAGFWLDQHLRNRRGPWAVEFARARDGAPLLVIRQDQLDIHNVQIRFRGENAPEKATTVRFDAPDRPVPWGRVKYEDLTYLPGVVTLEVFGHEIELLPRTLYVNRHAVGWNSGTNITLTASERPATWNEPRTGKPEAQEQTPDGGGS